MKRRRFIYTAAAGTAGLAGCLGGDDDTENEDDPDEDEAVFDAMPRVENRPDAVYLPSHRDGMVMLDTETVGDVAVSPMLSIPHFFWIVETGIGEGYTMDRVDPPEGDSVHFMTTVWDTETGVVLPVDAGLSIEIEKAGQLVDSRTPWPMISQGMGFHFGDNYELDGDGRYTATISTGSMEDVRLTGEMDGRFQTSETVTVEFEMDAERRSHLVNSVELFDQDRWGNREAVPPMDHGEHGHGDDHHGDHHDDHHNDDHHDDHHNDDHHEGHRMPYSSLPEPEQLRGTLLGTPTFDDAVYATTVVEAGSRFVDGPEQYLVVSPRTPYNRCVLPQMSLSATIERADETIELGTLQPTLDHELEFHYGTAVEGLQNGDELVVSIDSVTQASRHQGYETAFTETGELRIEIDGI